MGRHYLDSMRAETDDERAKRFLRSAVFIVTGTAVTILAVPLAMIFAVAFSFALAVLTPFAIIRGTRP